MTAGETVIFPCERPARPLRDHPVQDEPDDDTGGVMSDDGVSCTVCGGIVPERITITRVPIDRLEWILLDVANLHLFDEERIVKRARRFNYIPTKKERVYRAAFLREYRRVPPFEVRQQTVPDEAGG